MSLHFGDVWEEQQISGCGGPQDFSVFQSHPHCHTWVFASYMLGHLKGVLAESTRPEGPEVSSGPPQNPQKQPDPSVALKQGKQSVPESLCPIYLGKERIFISTSKENVRLHNIGDEENETFFLFLEKSVVK